eukprot:4240623-Prymnesium_polylepis.1
MKSDRFEGAAHIGPKDRLGHWEPVVPGHGLSREARRQAWLQGRMQLYELGEAALHDRLVSAVARRDDVFGVVVHVE